MEVASRPFLILGQLPVGISDRLPFIPIGKITPTYFAAYKEKVIFLVLNLGLLLNSHYKTLLVVKAIPPEVPSLLRGPLDRMGLCKCAACIGQPTQLARRYERTYVVPGRRHNLRRRQVILI